jgi:hypothetical protein
MLGLVRASARAVRPQAQAVVRRNMMGGGHHHNVFGELGLGPWGCVCVHDEVYV